MISVIIPAYNAEKTIARALDSIKNQEGDFDFEIIIVNDGSTDNTLEIIRNYSLKNPQTNILLITQENKGVAESRNMGIKSAKGEFIAFLDADDAWYKDKTMIQLGYLNTHKDVCLVGCSTNSFDLKSTFYKKLSEESTIYFKDQLLRNYFQPSTVIFKKKCLSKVGMFPKNQRYAEEGLFFFKFTYNFKCALINKCLVNYCDGKGGFGVAGLSSNIKKMHEGEIRNLKTIRDLKWISGYQFILYLIYYKIKYFRRKLLANVASK